MCRSLVQGWKWLQSVHAVRLYIGRLCAAIETNTVLDIAQLV